MSEKGVSDNLVKRFVISGNEEREIVNTKCQPPRNAPTSNSFTTPFLIINYFHPHSENSSHNRLELKAQAVPSEKIGKVIGVLDDANMMAVNRALELWLGFA